MHRKKEKPVRDDVHTGCIALDRLQTEQFQVWGVCSRLSKVLDTNGNWHSALDCLFVRAGEISVSMHRRRDMLFNRVDWDDTAPASQLKGRDLKFKVA